MKKFGFTLSELVIAVSIIGVAAALVIPVAGKLVPDTRKSTVLKYYVNINNAVNEYYNSNFYQPKDDCSLLACFDTTGNENGPQDFAEFLKDELGLDGDISPDGISVTITDPDKNGDYSITLDTNINNTGATRYTTGVTLDEVDSFRFKLRENGDVLAGDALTDAYLQNQYNWQAKSDDINKAKALSQKKKYD